MEKKTKTNVIRLLEIKKADFKVHYYTETDAIAGMEVAAVLNENPDKVFKTLVTIGTSKEHYVFMVPVNKELNLKKAAQIVGEKKIEMIKSKDLLALTGYIHGGCSPIGMKKDFITVINDSAADFNEIYFSGGKIGVQIEANINELQKIIDIQLAKIL